MTMADSSDNILREDDDKIFSVDHADPPQVTLVCSSNARKFSRGTYDRDRRACNLDLSNSPSLRPGSAARDSGYNTDVSPAATISPATNTPRQQQHFVFDNISHNNIPELEDRISSLSHVPSYLTSGSIAISPLAPGCHSPYQLHFEQRSRSTPPLRLSPDIFKVGASPCRTSCLGTQTPSRPVSEASDTSRVQFDFESDNEDDSTTRGEATYLGSRIPAASRFTRDNYDQSESCLGLPTPILCHDSDEGDDEDVFHKSDDVFHKSDDVLKNWGVRADNPTPINRSRFSIRQRRYCSADDDDSLLGACGGRDPSSDVLFLGANLATDRRRHSFNESTRGRTPTRRPYVRKAASGSEIEDNAYANGSVSCTYSESTLSSSQYAQPCHFDACDSRDSDCDNVFTFDDIDGDEDATNASQLNTRDTQPLTILRDRRSHNSALCTRMRRFSVTAYLRLSSGCLLPWSNSMNRVSVATQTPHMVSVMIRQLLETPVPLPNEARGTVAASLRRRQSEGGLPQGARQLPDIVPYVRDRAMSVPDAQTLALMQQAREVGRELRRLSDVHFGIFNLESVTEEVDSRFRRQNQHFLSNPLSNILAFFRQKLLSQPRRRRAFRPGRSTSVDRSNHLAASMEISEQSEDLPGD